MVGDQTVRRKHVGTYLVAPLDGFLLGVQAAHLFFLLLLFDFEHLGTQDAHGNGAVLVLRALLLAVDGNARRDVRNAHGGLGLIDVLAARAARPHDVDAEILLVDVELDGLVDVWIDEDAGERSMASRLRVERRDAHQAMHAVFRAQVAVSPLAGDAEGNALDTRFVPRLQVEDLALVAAPYAPTH